MVKLAIVLILSAVILAAIVGFVGFERTRAAVQQAGVGAFAGVGATVVAVLLLHAAAWMALNRPIQHKVPFPTLLEAVVVGMAGNILTPSTYLGGEPLKVLYVGRATRHPYHEVAGTVLLSKYLEALSFVLFFGVSTLVAAVAYGEQLFGPYLAAGVTLVLVAAGLLAAFVVLWLSLSRRWRPLARVLTALARAGLFRRFLARLRGRARVMEDQVSRVFCEEAKTARLVFGLFLLAHAAIFVRPALFFLLGYQVRLGLREMCLLFVASQAVLAFQVTPSGVGPLDGGLILTFALMGLDTAQDAAQCMAYLLCLRLCDALLVGIGLFLATRVGAEILTAKPPPTTDLIAPSAQGAEERAED